MAEDKKNYWFQMQRDFYKRHDVKLLMSMPNGHEYCLFYNIIMCESIDHEGTLRFSDKKAYTPEMLASVAGFEPKIAVEAMETLQDLEMVETMEDGTYYIPYVAERLGVESKWAKYKRAQRDQKKDENEACPIDVQKMSNECPTMSKKCPTQLEKELEIKKELEIEKEYDDDDLLIINKLTAREQKDLKEACGGSKGFNQLMRYAGYQILHRNERSPISDWFQYVRQIGVNGGFIADG